MKSEFVGMSDQARRWGIAPRTIADLFYAGKLRDDLCPVVAGRRLLPISYLPFIEMALRRAGKLPRKAVAHDAR